MSPTSYQLLHPATTVPLYALLKVLQENFSFSQGTEDFPIQGGRVPLYSNYISYYPSMYNLAFVTPFLLRLFLAITFLVPAIMHLLMWKDTVAMISGKIPLYTEVWLGIGVGLMLIGALSILLGWKTRMGGFLLMILLVIISVIFHFNFQNPAEIVTLGKHLGLIGGLLMISVYGAGPISVDEGMGDGGCCDEEEEEGGCGDDACTHC
jgi:putative oxidoreductase